LSFSPRLWHEARAIGAGAGGSIKDMGDEECIHRRMNDGCTSRGRDEAAVRSRERGVDQVIGELAGRQHGVVARWQLERSGIGRGAVDGRVGRRVLIPLHLGVYGVGCRPSTVEARWIAAVLACGPGAGLSHRTAGQLWGIVPRGGSAPEVTRPGFFRQRSGIVCHRSELPPDERGEVRGIPVTSVPRTLFDLAGMSSMRELERAFHEVETRELRDALSLPHLLARYPRRRGAANLRALLRSQMPVGVTQNDFEELFVEFLDEHGLPRPRLNGTLPVRGRLLKPDCMWPERRLLAELDGGAVHRTKHGFESDRQRDRLLLVDGWRSMRITWRQLRVERAQIAADLRELLE
jgi:very-short-patch-repair endonuclease